MADYNLIPHPDSELEPEELTELHKKLVAELKRIREGLGVRMSEAISGDTFADEMDAAQRHTEQANLMRFADKERKLLAEIEHALKKIVGGEYGICEGTGDPIALKRLQLRPWTRYSVAYKEQLEREKRTMRA